MFARNRMACPFVDQKQGGPAHMDRCADDAGLAVVQFGERGFGPLALNDLEPSASECGDDLFFAGTVPAWRDFVTNDRRQRDRAEQGVQPVEATDAGQGDQRTRIGQNKSMWICTLDHADSASHASRSL
jgi:hypothetical protein